jgi:hypothetical protein
MITFEPFAGHTRVRHDGRVVGWLTREPRGWKPWRGHQVAGPVYLTRRDAALWLLQAGRVEVRSW